MKKLILILSLMLLPVNAFAKCTEASGMGKNILRCENDEAVCYLAAEGISCFRQR